MKTNQLKLMDCLLVWGIGFLLFGILGAFLSDVIGIWAFYLCQIGSAVAVLTVAGKTGLTAKKLLTAGGQSMRESIGAALVWVGCLLAVIPLFLLSHLLVPGFAVTSFHVYHYTSSHVMVVGLILLAAICECLLFDCFLYTRLRGIFKAQPWLPIVILGVAGGLYHPDLYILLPMMIVSAGIAYVRSRTGGFLLPMILRLLTVLIALAYMQVSDAGEALLGSSMGLVQVIGFSLIFAGAAFPALICGARMLGHFKDRSLFEKCMVVAISVILIASGSGISTF
ncbi:MAG: CPBP family intramembrane metalloprotease [Clostridia bacterium]|nr:CPBP family intramembrane metalloprotease [Clostridia bacterium]